MRTLSILILIASIVPASAVATTSVEGCHADAVCATEGSYGSDCADFAGGYTHVSAGAASVTGSYDCYPGGGTQSVVVSTPVVGVYWGEFHYDDPKFGQFQSCFVFVGDVYSTVPCELGPPNPGWGNVLP